MEIKGNSLMIDVAELDLLPAEADGSVICETWITCRNASCQVISCSPITCCGDTLSHPE